MAVQSRSTESQSRIAATTELNGGAGGVAAASPGQAMTGGVLVSAIIAMSLGALLLTPQGIGLTEQALHVMHGTGGGVSSTLPVPLTAIGVGLALIMVFLAQAYRHKTSEVTVTVATVLPATGGPSGIAPVAPEPVEWVGEVTSVSTLTRGSMELYGDELVSDLLIIDNISPLKVRKLEGIGIRTRVDLLRIGRSQLGRQDIARRTGIGVRQLTDWLNKADLMRIEGPPALTMPMIRLLEVAGIETLEDLAVARPEAILRKLHEFSKRQASGLVLPTIEELSAWVDTANTFVS